MSSVVISGDTSGAVTISAPAVAGTTTLTLPATSGTILQSGTTVTEAQGGTGTTTGYYGFKNRIINGAMVIDQRNAGASVTVTSASSGYPVDRFRIDSPIGQSITGQQVTASLSGFQNAFTYTSGTASTNAADQSEIVQFIEGYNVADLQFGTANAQTITFSFWAKSSLTGTFGLIFENGAADRKYVTSYSLPTANTWTYISKTIVGDTSGTWYYTNGRGIGIRWDMGAGTTYSGAVTNAWGASSLFGITAGAGVVKLTQNTGATFTITGVQLEKGSTATSFDYRPYGTELIMCQRYYYQFSSTGLSDYAYAYTPYSPATYTSLPNTSASMPMYFPVTMRAAPTVTGTPNVGSLNRSTSTTGLVVFQYSSTSSGSAYAVTAYTATAEL